MRVLNLSLKSLIPYPEFIFVIIELIVKGVIILVFTKYFGKMFLKDIQFVIVVGRLVVVIDANPSHWFWIARLMKVFGHEGQCTCRYNTHGWIIYIMLFIVVCGTSRGSSWLRRNEFLKMTK
jgi:hypothetical protein